MIQRYWIPLVFGLAGMSSLTVAQAADVSIASAIWNPTGAAGLIRGNHNAAAGDALLGASPAGSALFGYLSTFGGVEGVSPLTMTDTEPGFNQTNGSRVVSGPFTLAGGAHLTLWFNYVSTDGRGYEDYAWARLVSADTHQTTAWLYTARSGNAPDNNGTSDYVPGKVLTDQVDFDDLDSHDPNRQIAAVLNDGNPVLGVASNNTQWAPLGDSSGICWDVGTSCGYTGWVKSDYLVATTGSYILEFGVTNWGDAAFDTALAFDFVGLSPSNFNNMVEIAAVPEPETWALWLAGLGLVGYLTSRRGIGDQLSARRA